jgi:hypothetical protein
VLSSKYNLVLLLLHAETESWGVLIWSPRLIHATERILNFSLTPSRDTVILAYPHNVKELEEDEIECFTIRRNLKQQLVIINAILDALKQELLVFLRGHAAA